MKPKLTKWLNIAVGIFFTLFTLLVGISSITAWRAFYVFLSFLESILTAIVVVKAWNLPKIKNYDNKIFTQKIARIAGFLYLGVVITGIFTLMYVPKNL